MKWTDMYARFAKDAGGRRLYRASREISVKWRPLKKPMKKPYRKLLKNVEMQRVFEKVKKPCGMSRM